MLWEYPDHPSGNVFHFRLVWEFLNFDQNLFQNTYTNRLISIPTKLLDLYFRTNSKSEEISDKKVTDIHYFSNQNSSESSRSINNPGSDITAEIPLISADGEIEETFACLKMLAKYFKVPFKQDSVLKTLNSLKKQMKI